jgi:hypothetical protein
LSKNNWVSHIVVVCKLAEGCYEKHCLLHEFTLKEYPDAMLVCLDSENCLLDKKLMKKAITR